jgi:hypothetical protein
MSQTLSNSFKIALDSPDSLDSLNSLDSLDSAPLCFFLFNYVKHSLKRDSYASEDAFHLEIHTILREILLTILEAAFKKWIERLLLIASHKSYYCA